MSVSRLWLSLIVVCFCLPLFVGLGRGDARDDEAIYSFAVDRILQSGVWLEPKSIPNDEWAFLEKPPLKFWIIAAGIRSGVLPDNEYGRRFWDALFGALSFVYVFLIGSMLIGPVCGAAAVLILFAHEPLLYVHGLRNNNMEAPLLLAYCGGVYHFLAWGDASRPRRRASLHAAATALYFTLGFMTKFVAVLFLDLVLGLAAILVPRYRRLLWQEWRVWAGAAALFLLLSAPWFIWAHRQYGAFFWTTIFGESVITRFTRFLDPNHVQPWHFYFSYGVQRLEDAHALILCGAGLMVLAVQAVRRRWPEALVILLWFAVPMALMSFGTSKLYHYAYPFLPPVALAGGYVAALAVAVLPPPVERSLEWLRTALGIRRGGGIGPFARPWPRRLAIGLAAAAVGVAVYSIVVGPLRLSLGGTDVRSSRILRPLVFAALFGAVAGATRTTARVVVSVVVLSTLPFAAYRSSLGRLQAAEQPIRDARDCIAAVQAGLPGPMPGLYVDVPPAATFYNVLYYHFRQIRPWLKAASPSPDNLGKYLDDPKEWRPMLVWEPVYQEFRSRFGDSSPSPAMIVFDDVEHGTLLLLPGPYAACSAEARVSSGRAWRP
jgi:4-amino-4-deoxy-L-arabinose transferase-like glycosyltransferase